MTQEFDLDGRVAVVTGAASGLGRGITQVLTEAGAHVIGADVDEAGLAETAGMIRSNRGTAQVLRTDVSDPDAMEALAWHAIDAFGRIDIWVNAAGVLRFASIVDATQADLDALIAANLKGVYWGCAAAARAMQDQGSGSIINISSTGADTPAPGLSIYSLTKSAVNMLTRTAATEFGPMGIRVNAVAPGSVETPMVAFRYRDASGGIDIAKREEVRKDRAAASPLGLAGTPRDIGLTVLYLASDASRMMTGQVLRPNGGVSMP